MVVLGDEAQSVWFEPALAIEGAAIVVTVTFDTEVAQGKFEIDQVKTVVPAVNPVNVEFGERELVIVPGPEIFTHLPIPAVGVLPASVVDPVVAQIV
jgi:hypothetical protein